MIRYNDDGFGILFKMNGSVFPKALKIALPACMVSVALCLLIHEFEYIPDLKAKDSIMINSASWGSFSFLVGFLVVFRTQQAYARFWEANTKTREMNSEWTDACSALIAFSKGTKSAPEEVLNFQNTLIRLFSMIHAAALGELEHDGVQTKRTDKNYVDCRAFRLELIDPMSLDDESIQFVLQCDSKVRLLFQWIQELIVHNVQNGVLCMPPPFVARCFQQLDSGMVKFEDALKIAEVPFPFPYAQTCTCLLTLHWLLTPFVVSQWSAKPWWGAVFTFIQVFGMWSLNIIGLELENPFGEDANDIDTEALQTAMNHNLRQLVRPGTKRVPSMKKVDFQSQTEATERVLDEKTDCRNSFLEMWSSSHKVASRGRATASRDQGSTDDDVNVFAELSWTPSSENAFFQEPVLAFLDEGQADVVSSTFQKKGFQEEHSLKPELSDGRDSLPSDLQMYAADSKSSKASAGSTVLHENVPLPSAKGVIITVNQVHLHDKSGASTSQAEGQGTDGIVHVRAREGCSIRSQTSSQYAYGLSDESICAV